MSDLMRPIPFKMLLSWVMDERSKHNTVFGVHRQYSAPKGHVLGFLGEKLETPFGPAAGPHTQLAQNIVASYYTGNRFFELKTVQTLDGEDLPVSKPCILAEDECYNVEWSTELRVPEGMEEYIKGWLMCKIMAVEFDMGAPDGFMFNMSVGYDLEGIKSQKIDSFIEGLKDASTLDFYKSCVADIIDYSPNFKRLTREEILAFSPRVCRSITLSTLHGCPPDEIERIAKYLIEEKQLHTFVKCNPTLLGYDYARQTLNALGYDYVQFDDHHYLADLQFEDAVPMFERLLKVAEGAGLNFGVKITNTCPVDNLLPNLPGEEMYMSGRSLYPLSLSVAIKLSKAFGGKLRISFSGGIDYYSVERLYNTGVWPITMATTYLKTGGYARAVQMADLFTGKDYQDFTSVDVTALEKLFADSMADDYFKKPIKPLPSRKMADTVPLIDCYVAPCRDGCPINQDIPHYLNLAAEGKYKEALEVILDKNPLPFMTGMICNHKCMDKCTRTFYEESLHIRSVKLEAAQKAFDQVKAGMAKPAITLAGKTAIIGGGPAGIAAAHLLARAGKAVTIFEKEAELGGVVKQLIPEFRKMGDEIYRDIELLSVLGVDIQCNQTVSSIADLKAQGYSEVIVATGAWLPSDIAVEGTDVVDALDFLKAFKQTNGQVKLGEHIIVIGAGNTAMDVARAAKRCQGAVSSSILYRRTKRYMPADEEELQEAIEDGVAMQELLVPVKHEGRTLYCKRVKLGDYDESGRRKPIITDQIIEIPADTIIAAVGEKADAAFYQSNGIAIDNKGLPVVDQNMMSSQSGVYVIGDAMAGPAVIVKAIANATVAANAIIGQSVTSELAYSTDESALYQKKGNLEFPLKVDDGQRCLSCNVVCSNCADVCPNRANVVIEVPGKTMSQIVHVDYMCNECGNCTTFCPYDSAPYKDKFTLFKDQADFENSENEGFYLDGAVKVVRLDGKTYRLEGKNDYVPQAIVNLMQAVTEQYDYLIFR